MAMSGQVRMNGRAGFETQLVKNSRPPGFVIFELSLGD
jgi:hypothetical protein